MDFLLWMQYIHTLGPSSFPRSDYKDITPFKVKKLLFWGSDNPNVIVNVSNFEKEK